MRSRGPLAVLRWSILRHGAPELESEQLAMLEQIQRRGQYHGRINYENNHTQ